MNMEKFGAKKEALVPDNKQEEFTTASTSGKELEQKSKELETEAKGEKTLSKVQIGSAVGLGTLGVLTGNPIGAGIGAVAATMYGLDARASRKKAARFSERAKEAKGESEKEYTTSRSIVEEGMKDGGAADEGGNVGLRATPEQIEIARKEMEEKYMGSERVQ